jgi:hypothetical protein
VAVVIPIRQGLAQEEEGWWPECTIDLDALESWRVMDDERRAAVEATRAIAGLLWGFFFGGITWGVLSLAGWLLWRVMR